MFFKRSSASKTETKLIDEKKFEERITNIVYKDLLLEDDASDVRVKEIITWHVNKENLSNQFSLNEIEILSARIFNKLRRLGILQPLLDNEEITEIMVNGADNIFYEMHGQIFESDLRFSSVEELTNMLISFFSRHNENLSISRPMASLKLEDGSRAHAVLAPIAPDGPIFTIRKFTGIKPSIDELISSSFLSEELSSFLEDAVKKKRGIIISGGTGTGKTTLLNVLSAFIPNDERIVSVEDSPELQLQDKNNWVSLVVREDLNNPINNVDMDELIRNSLRMRPDRIIVGEVRGKEAYAMLRSAQTGHQGTLCTIHANDARGTIYRLADLCTEGSKLNYDNLVKQIISAFELIINIKRDEFGERYISEIASIEEDKNEIFKLNFIYQNIKE